MFKLSYKRLQMFWCLLCSSNVNKFHLSEQSKQRNQIHNSCLFINNNIYYNAVRLPLKFMYIHISLVECLFYLRRNYAQNWWYAHTHFSSFSTIYEQTVLFEADN